MSAAELIPALHLVAEDAEFARVLAEAGFAPPEPPLPELVAEAVRWAWPEPRVRHNKMFSVDEIPQGRGRTRISLASGSQESCLLAAAMLFSRPPAPVSLYIGGQFPEPGTPLGALCRAVFALAADQAEFISAPSTRWCPLLAGLRSLRRLHILLVDPPSLASGLLADTVPPCVRELNVCVVHHQDGRPASEAKVSPPHAEAMFLPPAIETLILTTRSQYILRRLAEAVRQQRIGLRVLDLGHHDTVGDRHDEEIGDAWEALINAAGAQGRLRELHVGPCWGASWVGPWRAACGLPASLGASFAMNGLGAVHTLEIMGIDMGAYPEALLARGMALPPALRHLSMLWNRGAFAAGGQSSGGLAALLRALKGCPLLEKLTLGSHWELAEGAANAVSRQDMARIVDAACEGLGGRPASAGRLRRLEIRLGRDMFSQFVCACEPRCPHTNGTPNCIARVWPGFVGEDVRRLAAGLLPHRASLEHIELSHVLPPADASQQAALAEAVRTFGMHYDRLAKLHLPMLHPPADADAGLAALLAAVPGASPIRELLTESAFRWPVVIHQGAISRANLDLAGALRLYPVATPEWLPSIGLLRAQAERWAREAAATAGTRAAWAVIREGIRRAQERRVAATGPQGGISGARPTAERLPARPLNTISALLDAPDPPLYGLRIS